MVDRKQIISAAIFSCVIIFVIYRGVSDMKLKQKSIEENKIPRWRERPARADNLKA
jgi:hypothetical protein